MRLIDEIYILLIYNSNEMRYEKSWQWKEANGVIDNPSTNISAGLAGVNKLAQCLNTVNRGGKKR